MGDGDLAGTVRGTVLVLWLLACGETGTVIWKEKKREETLAGTWGTPGRQGLGQPQLKAAARDWAMEMLPRWGLSHCSLGYIFLEGTACPVGSALAIACLQPVCCQGTGCASCRSLCCPVSLPSPWFCHGTKGCSPGLPRLFAALLAALGVSGKSGVYPANGQGRPQAAQAPFALAHC